MNVFASANPASLSPALPLPLPFTFFLIAFLFSSLHPFSASFFYYRFIWLVLSWALPSYLLCLPSLILLPFMCPFPLSNVFLRCPSYKQPPTDPYMQSGCSLPARCKHRSPPLSSPGLLAFWILLPILLAICKGTIFCWPSRLTS